MKNLAHRPHLALLLILFLVLALNRSSAQQPAKTFNVVEASIADIHQAVRASDVTCEQLVQSYLSRIAAYDQTTSLNSIVVLNTNALSRAAELDRLFQESGKLLPLHGIPVIVKDNYDVSGLPTTAGSLALEGSIPPDDAYQIQKLREAGAIFLCKSNMAEWAYSPMVTVSSIRGVTRNPYDLQRVPAGSSGGTAAAVAASFGTVGLGTDTGNSIRGPSSHCALVGLRPTLGLTSRDGIVPLFLRNDVGGPMCRTVEDAARVLQVIAGFDRSDPITEKSRGKVSESYVKALDANSLQGARIGVFRTLSESETRDAQVGELFEKAITDLRSLGAEIVDPFEIDDLNRRQLLQAQGSLWRDTFRHDIADYLGSVGPSAPVKSLEEIIDSEKFHASVRNRLAASLRAGDHSDLRDPYSADPDDDPARKQMLEQVASAMDRARVDAFIFPTWNNPPREVDDLDSPNGNNSFQIPPHTGQPAITVPMGFTSEGLPAGLQMVGRPFSESTLLSLAFAFEQATRHRVPPERFPDLR